MCYRDQTVSRKVKSWGNHWQQFAKAGPVTVRKPDGSVEVEDPLKPGQVRKIVKDAEEAERLRRAKTAHPRQSRVGAKAERALAANARRIEAKYRRRKKGDDNS